MSNDEGIGYPISTNRSGSWNPQPAAQFVTPSKPGISELIQPVQHQARQDRGLMGIDDLEGKILDIVNSDLKLAKILLTGISQAVDASRMTHPSFIGRSAEDHKISLRDQKIRFQWCVWFAQQARFDLHWTIKRIAESLPNLLESWLNGEFWQLFKERRKFWSRSKTPKGLKGKAP